VPADDVETEENVIADPGIDEDLDLIELLASQPDGPRSDLHAPDRRNLVRLDVRAIGFTLHCNEGLYTFDIRFHPIELDGHGGSIEVIYCRHFGTKA
jgi:hypothetical protein